MQKNKRIRSNLKIQNYFYIICCVKMIFLKFYSIASTSAVSDLTDYQLSEQTDFYEEASLTNCPKGCLCDELNSLRCENLELTRIPLIKEWPNQFEKILLRNCTLMTINSNAFWQFKNLREIRLERMPNMDLIDKYAFKGLQKLRLIQITENPKLRELHKTSFSGIGNEFLMRIIIKNNGIQKIRSWTFKNANNLRELTIEEVCFQVETLAFASIHKIDFLTVKGACFIDKNSFKNTSRVHNLNIIDSTIDIKQKTFAQLHHVNQIQLRKNRIGNIEEDSFAETFTIGSAHLQSNRIGKILPRAFAHAENLGLLVLSYNTIQDALESPDCLKNEAQKFVFTENTLYCSCEMRWIQFYQNSALLMENYCGREEAFKALSYYKPLGCSPLASSVWALISDGEQQIENDYKSQMQKDKPLRPNKVEAKLNYNGNRGKQPQYKNQNSESQPDEGRKTEIGFNQIVETTTKSSFFFFRNLASANRLKSNYYLRVFVPVLINFFIFSKLFMVFLD